jgi:hypothetical protein
MLCSRSLSEASDHDASRCQVEKVYLYPNPVDFRKSIDGLTAPMGLDIEVAVFDPVRFVFLKKPRSRVKILYWEHNGFYLWLKRLESERFKTSPDHTNEASNTSARSKPAVAVKPRRSPLTSQHN